MSTAFSGVLGTVKSGTTDMDVEGWDADYEVAEIETTTTADAGWEDAIPGPKKISGSFDFFYNTSKKPTGVTANLSAGSTAALTLQTTTGETLVGNALITKLSFKNKVKDGCKVTASFRSKGTWTLPS